MNLGVVTIIILVILAAGCFLDGMKSIPREEAPKDGIMKAAGINIIGIAFMIFLAIVALNDVYAGQMEASSQAAEKTSLQIGNT